MERDYGQLSDEELFDLISSGKKTSESAFKELYARLSPRVFAYCRRFLGNQEQAQDVFQEAFVKFYQSASRDRVMTNVPAFLLKIARNLCVNAKRRERHHLSFEEYMEGRDDDRTERDELMNLIKKAIELLPDDYKEVFLLREYDGLSYADISDTLDLPLSTVKIRIFRAKKKMRVILAPYFEEIKKYE